ncbi:MAG: response regulator [Treponema sp.]|jgi:signal transduction histidine kinase/DNA-binding response OmpR family regulator|nr:response regulator [Treponema sp.]
MTLHKQNISGYLVFIFYAAAMLVAALYVWNEKNNNKHSRNSPIYTNLRECPTYARKGFDPADLRKIPDERLTGVWKRFETSSRRIIDSGLDIPKRSYLSPWGKDEEEFTVVFLLEMDSTAMAYINGTVSVIPGIYFAGLGEGWEVYFNGKLILSELHLSETGRIRERRTWNDVSFPVDGSFVIPGTNILAVRILGDPTYRGTGLYYTSAPIYMDNYRNIETRRINYLYIFLCGFFAFTGIYYMMLFLSVKKKIEIFNLYFGLFSILICVYIVSLQGLINSLFYNSDISRRLEFGSLMMAIPIFGMFLEALGRGETTKISRGYLAFSSFLCLTQTFFCRQYGEEVIIIWNVITMIYASYLLFYEVIYFHFWNRKKLKSGGSMPIGNILIGMVICYLCGAFDFLHNTFFKDNTSLFSYSVFVVYIGMVFTMSKRFSVMYKQLEQSNVILESTVKERTLELEEQTAIAMQASRAKSEFLATMSHEIRTPLNAVIGLSEIELRNGPSPSSSENIIQIHQSGVSLLGIINDILDISKIEAGSFELVPVEYKTAPFIHDTVNLNMVRYLSKGNNASKPINFVLEINGDFPAKLIGDELRVKEVLNNLLSNAIKYTDEGTITLNISWSAHCTGMVKLVFTVRDTGMGIRAEDIKKLFTSYTQLDTGANRKIEGTGLGLAITKNLVEMMGGSISVESKYGSGSVFTAEIIQGIENAGISREYEPIGEETAEALRNFCYASETRDKIITLTQMPHAQILVVDDLPVNLLVARGLLAPYGLQTDTAASGREAIELVNKNKYDLIFMDHMMPEMDGIETAAAIRKIEGYAHTPIVALTANALRGMKELYLEKGFDDYLSKPISPEALDVIINKLLNKRETADTSPSAPYSLAVEERRIDKLNHYRSAFEMSKTSGGLEIDTEYYRRFTSLVESFDALPVHLQADKALLIEAGRNEDAQKICGILPAFCENIAAMHRSKADAVETDAETKNEIVSLILQRLKKAIQDGDTAATGKITAELGAESLTPRERELYFKLYDLRMDDNTEKLLETLDRYGGG